jgi:16S rRNA (cytosine1402-N4)-methyltransferase
VTQTTQPHCPVLLAETLQYLNPKAGLSYLDATLGAGGHAQAILEQLGETGTLLGLDQDFTALTLAKENLKQFGRRFEAVHANFSEVPDCLPSNRMPLSGGILADIGVSSMQLDQTERGFSFRRDAPLDMRMNQNNPVTAASLVNTYTCEQLIRIFSDYGEEHLSKSVANAIITQRQKEPFNRTMQLANCITAVYQGKGKSAGKIHPATRVFQALRIAVNRELEVLETFLDKIPQMTLPGTRIVIITFHSLEDRIVKRFFQQQSQQCICPPGLPVCCCQHNASLKLITRKPVVATPAEISKNPRSRSAKLRCAERL